MGIEYYRYLIPRANQLRPTANQLASFVEALAGDRWIPTPGSSSLRKMAELNGKSHDEAAQTWAHVNRPPVGRTSAPFPLDAAWFAGFDDRDLCLKIPVEYADQIGLQPPLVCNGPIPADPYYDVEIHLSRDYVERISELIEPIETKCSCGEELGCAAAADPFFASRIRVRCPKCNEPFLPFRHDVVFRDGWTRAQSTVRGGAVYRFALVIDFHVEVSQATKGVG